MSNPAPIPLQQLHGSPSASFTELVGAIVASDLAEPLTRHIDAGSLPNRDEVTDIVRKLRELLFPGYFGKQQLSAQTLDYYVGELLGDIRARLLKQVDNVIRHQASRHGGPGRDIDGVAERIVQAFLESIPGLRATLATDVQAAFSGDPAAEDTDEVIFSYPGIFAITVHRIAHELYLLKVPLIPRIMSEYAHALTGIDIHPGATIDEYFFIDHGTGVVIGETTVIGPHVKIYQGVTLGAKSFVMDNKGHPIKGGRRHPKLENGVIVYAGASIMGGDTVIGENSVVGSNVSLMESIPANSIAVRQADGALIVRPRQKRDAMIGQVGEGDYMI